MSLERYYNLFDPQRGEAELMFRAGDGLQSRELNELQSVLQHRISGIANAIFKDGDLIRDAQLIVDIEAARTAVMCSESVWWRCHRRIIADVIALEHSIPVEHLMHTGRLSAHEPSEGARLDGSGRILWDGADA